MTRATRNISLTQDHCDLIARVARERRMKFSEALRIIIDFAIDHDATLGLPFHADRVKSLQADLSTAQEAIKSLEQQKASNGPEVFERVNNSVNTATRATPKAPSTDRRPGLTERERFLKAAPYVADGDDVVTPEMRVRTLAQARMHPDWLTALSKEQEAALREKMATWKGRK